MVDPLKLIALSWQSNRQQKVLDYVSVVHDLCTVLGMDFFSTITEVHPSLDDSIDVNCKSISDDTLSKLDKTVVSLKEDKKTRLHKVCVTFQENVLSLLLLILQHFV